MPVPDHATRDTPKLNFIRDIAADTDFFGSHERVARAISSVVVNNADLKVIGLLGRWGSGKSTVVKHVQRHLNAQAGPDTYVFTYDAWLHQSDPPRRAFLETLTAFLTQEKLAKPGFWTAEMEVLNRQVENTETTSTPALTVGGVIFLLSLVLIPLGMHFIDHDWYAAATGKDAGWFDIAAYVAGWIMLLTPVVVGVGVAVFAKDRQSLLALFVNRQVEKQVNRTVRAPDPTTIEFQKLFREIVEALPAGCRLILVIDNLDRLNETEAVAMWATIRSFFLGAEHADRSRRSASLPTVLLPIDQDAVERMYSVEHGEKAGKRLARAFLDKTFDLSFHVTPPVLSDWAAYLAAQLKEVFGDHVKDDWSYQIARLYEARPQHDREITPRAINVTLNEIATLWLQWRDLVPMVTIACFVIFREEIEGDLFAAVTTPIVHIGDIDPNWSRGLAALHYGAPPDKAIQVLIEPRLRTAMLEQNQDEFRELSQLPGFAETLQRMLDGLRPAMPQQIGQVSRLLVALAPEPAVWVDAAWRTLRGLYVTARPFESFNQNDVEGLKALLAACPPQQTAGLVRQIARHLSTQTLDVPFGSTEDSPVRFVDLLKIMADAAKEGMFSMPSVRHNGALETYLDVLRFAAEVPAVAAAFTSSTSIDRVIAALAAQFGRGGSFQDEKVRALAFQAPKADWSAVIEASQKILTLPSQSATATFAAAGVLGRFLADESVTTLVGGLSSTGQLNSRISEAQAGRQLPTMARLTALALLAEAPLATPSGQGWESFLRGEPTFAMIVRANIDAYSTGGIMRSLVKTAKGQPEALPLVRAIMTSRVIESDLGLLNVGDVIDRLPEYLNVLASGHDAQFIIAISAYPTLWGKLEERALDVNVRRILVTLAFDEGASKETRKRARKLLKIRLQTITVADWSAAIQADAEPLTSALLLNAVSNPSLNVGPELFAALNGMLTELVAEAPAWRSRWFAATKLLSRPSRKVLYRNLRDRMLASAVPGQLIQVLSAADADFLADADFAAMADGVARHILPALLGDANGIDWLTGNTDRVEAWVSAAPEDARAFLKELLQHHISIADENRSKGLKAATTTWKL